MQNAATIRVSLLENMNVAIILIPIFATMRAQRIEMLQKMIAEDASDPFPLYALALEYMQAEDFTSALPLFQKVHENFPDYVANYYQYGLTLVHAGQGSTALEILKAGIPVAQAAADRKTVNELQMLIEDLE